MEKRKRNIATIGALTIGAVIIFVTLLYWLLGNPLLSGGTDLAVQLSDGGGVKRGDRVQVQGVQVGSVRSVDLSPQGGVIVMLRVDDRVILPTDSRATMRGDVFGATTVILVPGKSMMNVADGDTIAGEAATQLGEMAGNISARAEHILTSADSLLAPSTVRDLRATAAILPAGATELRAALAEAHAAGESLRRSMAELENAKAGPALGSAINRVDESARAIAAASATVEQAALKLDASLERLRSITTKIDGGAGTLGLLVNDSSLYVEMNETLREIRALATDIRERPSRYIDLRLFRR
jgi:phospholipid/cholesterol/gamma-HCH transport system substrate-binding protein